MILVKGLHQKVWKGMHVQNVYGWLKAPWNHIKGDVKRALKDWNPRGHKHVCIDEVEAELQKILQVIINRHVKKTTPFKSGPRLWWNHECRKAFNYKLKCFDDRLKKPERYTRAIQCCKSVQRKASRKYQLKVKSKLAEISNADRNLWSTAKEISGLDKAKGSAASDVDDLAVHFF